MCAEGWCLMGVRMRGRVRVRSEVWLLLLVVVKR